MRLRIIIALVVLAFASQLHASQHEMGIIISPIFTKSFGHSNYEMNTYVGTEEGIPIYARSKLEFPLDAVRAGGRIGWYDMVEGRTEWAAELSLLTNINDPGGKMKDSDWFTSPGYSSLQFAYTESDVEMKSFIVNVEAARRFYSWTNASTYVILGFRYQKFEQDVIGFNGWQLDENLERVYHSYDELALYYEVTYTMPLAGIKYILDLGPRTSIGVTGAYMLTFVEDLDDHVLRNKESVADGTGYGVLGDIYYRHEFGGPGAGSRPFINLKAEIMTMKINTDQTQTWYGDDPISEEDDTGTVINDIPHEITSLQFNIGLSVGLAF